MYDVGIYRIERDAQFKRTGRELVGIVSFDGPKHADWFRDVAARIISFDKIWNYRNRVLADFWVAEHLYRQDRSRFNRGETVSYHYVPSLMPYGIMGLRASASADNANWGDCVNLCMWVEKVQDYLVMHPRIGDIDDVVETVCAQLVERSGVSFAGSGVVF